ncbi:hypothetical protein [Streptomyces sp. NPDC040750]
MSMRGHLTFASAASSLVASWVGVTCCPGTSLYAKLGTVRSGAARCQGR